MESFMSSSCTEGHLMAGCSACNQTCATPDPLLAYSAACTDMLMSGCEPWRDFCGYETNAAAQALCLPASERIYALAPPTSGDPCLSDPTQPSCASYVYPDSSAQADIDKLCGSMPDMPGCSLAGACAEGKGIAPKYCAKFTILATLCTDMPGMKGCENYKALCRKSGTVVAQCAKQPAIPGAPTWSESREAVFSACGDHPMQGCSSCSKTDCPDPLGSLASICQEMPEMSVCKVFWDFCDAAGEDNVEKWCSTSAGGYLPSMIMYFHQRIQELVLWKEWRPRTRGDYAGTIIAILAMGVVATGLKTFKGALVLKWAHDRAMSGEGPVRITNIWLPHGSQWGEIAIKSLITGVSLTIDYFNMLIAMTFNVGLFCAVIAGYVLGAIIFSHVLDNYGAILAQRRRAMALASRRVNAKAGGGMLSGCGPEPCGAPGSADPETGGVPASAAAGAAGRALSDEESEEEAYRTMVQQQHGEGECHCVHSV